MYCLVVLRLYGKRRAERLCSHELLRGTVRERTCCWVPKSNLEGKRDILCPHSSVSPALYRSVIGKCTVRCYVIVTDNCSASVCVKYVSHLKELFLFKHF